MSSCQGPNNALLAANKEHGKLLFLHISFCMQNLIKEHSRFVTVQKYRVKASSDASAILRAVWRRFTSRTWQAFESNTLESASKRGQNTWQNHSGVYATLRKKKARTDMNKFLLLHWRLLKVFIAMGSFRFSVQSRRKRKSEQQINVLIYVCMIHVYKLHFFYQIILHWSSEISKVKILGVLFPTVQAGVESDVAEKVWKRAMT